MKIAIVDDISDERTLLRNRLESQFSRRNVHTDICEECFSIFIFKYICMDIASGKLRFQSVSQQCPFV